MYGIIPEGEIELLAHRDGRYVCYRETGDRAEPLPPLHVALHLYHGGALHCYQLLFRAGTPLMEVVVDWAPHIGQHGQRRHRPSSAELVDGPCALTGDLPKNLRERGQPATLQGGRFTGRRGVILGHDRRMAVVAVDARRGYGPTRLYQIADVVRVLPAHVYHMV